MVQKEEEEEEETNSRPAIASARWRPPEDTSVSVLLSILELRTI